MKKLVVFDVDGVLTPERSSWIIIHRGLSKKVVVRCSKLRELFFNSPEMSHEKWAEEDIKLWGNVKLEKIKQILDKVPLSKGAKETCKALKEKGYLLAIISTGINILVERVTKELGIDCCVCNKLYEKNNKILAKLYISFDKNPKDKILKELMKRLKVKKKDVIIVGDSDDDYPMMKLAGFSILFNPNPDSSKLAKREANAIIKNKDLRNILKLIEARSRSIEK